MTPQDLLDQCDQSEKHGGTIITLKIKRKPRTDAQRMNVFPGLSCQLVQWGDGTWGFPSVVMCEIADVRKAVNRAIGSPS
mgnify:CR=1 FL=1